MRIYCTDRQGERERGKDTNTVMTRKISNQYNGELNRK